MQIHIMFKSGVLTIGFNDPDKWKSQFAILINALHDREDGILICGDTGKAYIVPSEVCAAAMIDERNDEKISLAKN